jgi:hypothetical protein
VKRKKSLDPKMDHWVRVLLQDGLLDRSGTPEYVRTGLERAARIIESMEPYQFRTDSFDEIADTLSECTELSDLSKLMWNAATSAGFENFIIFVLKNGANGALPSRVCTSCNSEWVTRYHAQRYQFVDPVMAAASRADGIYEFADLESSSPVIADFWADAEAHRIGRNGVCFARTRPDGARIGVSFITAKNEAHARRLVRLNCSDLAMIADLAVDAFCYASYGLAGEAEALSAEELRFLYLLATRKDPKEAFEVMPLYGSNKSLQASIRRKLGVETVFQAVSRAAARGYFDEVPYEASEVTRPFPSLVGLDPATLAFAEPDAPLLEADDAPLRETLEQPMTE